MLLFIKIQVYLLFSFFALAVPVLSSAATQLTPDTFKPSISSGLWFIEFFSPYCGHCRNFAPTWEKLVEAVADQKLPVTLAQVDCSAYGDLCGSQNVRGYPTMFMYNNGRTTDDDKFSDDRTVDLLLEFIGKYTPNDPPPEREPQKPIANVNGEVLSLTSATFDATLAQGHMFVKFFAPWCGHCKKLAPVWKSLAKSMQGKLNIAEVNCDDHPALCKSYGIQGYPTLIYILDNDNKSEYNGGRKIEQLRAFSEMAASAGLHSIQTADLPTRIAENEVMYVLVHSSNDILDTVRRTSTVLLGSPSIFTISDPSLLARYNIPQTSTWALIAFKDHDARVPTSILHERIVPASTADDTIRSWLLAQRLPTSIELTQDTFQGVMNAAHSPLVVIAAVSPKNSEEAAKRMKDIGKKWRVRTSGSGLTSNGREIIWTWMDADKWQDWVKSMYGIVVDAAPDLDAVPVVITDHKKLIYWNRDSADQRLKIASSKSLFEAVEAAATGSLAYKHSENMIERFARYTSNKLTALEYYVVNYPLRVTLFVFLILVVVFFVLKRWLANDAHEEYRKKHEQTKVSLSEFQNSLSLTTTMSTLSTASRISSHRTTLAVQTRFKSTSPYGRTHVWKRRPRVLPNPVVPKFPQLVIRSDGTSFTHWTTSPRSTIRLTRDTTNNPVWNTGAWSDARGVEEESSMTGRLGRFNRKFEEIGKDETSGDWMDALVGSGIGSGGELWTGSTIKKKEKKDKK
ncbi:hypothetical protein H0H93_001280 [Arthromyces matolae]|nr:hypothetical protein H0H93_001280 [Arthromyces matolae]